MAGTVGAQLGDAWDSLKAGWGPVAVVATVLGLVADALTLLGPVALWLTGLAVMVGISAVAVARHNPVHATLCQRLLIHSMVIAPAMVGLHFVHVASGQQDKGFVGDALMQAVKEKLDRIDSTTTSTQADVADTKDDVAKVLKNQEEVLNILKKLEGGQDGTSPANQQAQERAVTAAVTAAGEGNSRMAQAVALLRKGDIEAAIPLF
ncbi:MAG: hypothetical protein JHC88_17755, partial [Niveispirillum sp.]|nr:hypothetical protein [Niveispirillum sp.]